MCIEHVPGQCPVVKRAHLQRHRVRQGNDRTEVHPHDRMVKRLLQHVNAVSPAEGKRDKQMPLPPFSVKDLNDALMFVKGDCGIFWSHFWVLKKGWRTGSLLDCGQDREGPLG